MLKHFVTLTPPMQALNKHFSVYYLSEQAVTITFGDLISEEVLERVTAFNQLLNQHPFPGLRTAVTAYTTISVFYDPTEVIGSSSMHGADCFEKVSNYLEALTGLPSSNITTAGHLITVPVCYGGQFGPDLQEVANLHQLTTEQVISLHSNATYKVYMIGFIPGFAYLGGMNNRLDTPRKATPRKTVPAGSVGIAGKQTGIYPLNTPGGWQLIGKTPLLLFDANRPRPSLLKAGDAVVFKPISQHEFEYLANHPYADPHQ